jgi:hypothetical protein
MDRTVMMPVTCLNKDHGHGPAPVGPWCFSLSIDTKPVWPLNRENSAVCWDLDSTLADTRHRFHLIEKIKAGEATWDEHSLACTDDEPLTGAISLMRLLAPHHTQHIVSGRSAVAAYRTRAWLEKHQVPFDEICLRRRDDFTENGLIKARYVRELQALGIQVVMFFEDWPPVAAVVHEMTGVPAVVLTPPRALLHPELAPGTENFTMGTQ